ncbi:Uu.00g053330.m01.CDS01 [Anthostomella pinea]|uniref:Uu.00g053330.m01.CDS01 n=1 Tax=Anthostomella pinea TaxID=933095 RepID=A0AAI8YPH3_9PEZI|nr:Uu.00g053330.m01.CDS01 [Anthostomella pinea]
MTGRQATRTRQKYKDSCTNCAGAKVKCSKDRPICARCIERGLECSYGLSYRYGRLPARVKLNSMEAADRSTSTTPQRVLLPTESRTPSPSWTSSPSSEPDASQSAWTYEPNTGVPLDMGTTNSLNACFDYDYDPATSHNLALASLDGVSAPAIPFHCRSFQDMTPTSSPVVATDATFSTLNYLQGLDLDPQPLSRRYHSRSVSSVSSPPSGFEYQPTAFSNLPSTTFCTPPETPSHSRSGFSNSYHDCLSQASALLVTLRSYQGPPQITHVEITGQVLQIIECDCFSRDDYLRIIMILIAFEIMATYSKATQQGTSTITSAEGILEDLQVVLKLIERLLRRLREMASSPKRFSPTSGIIPNLSIINVSPAVFGQLEADLRKHLRGISNATMDVLRRG